MVIQVVWATTGQARPEHREWFSPAERERWAAYKAPNAQAQFAVGCAITRAVLAELTGAGPAELEIDRECSRCAGPHGKPRVPGSAWKFSVSHSGDRIGVAFAEGTELGLDIEQVTGAARDGVAGMMLAPAELAAWQAMPEPERTSVFYTYWARKESVLKATGDGLTASLPEVRVTPPGEPPRLLGYPGGAIVEASMADLDGGPGYAAALTVLGPGPMAPVEYRDAARIPGF